LLLLLFVFPPPLKPNQNQAKYQHHPTIRTSKITNTSYSIQQQTKDRIFFSLKPNQYFQIIISETERELLEVETAPVERERGAAGGGFRRTEEENSGEAAPARRLPTTNCTEEISEREGGSLRWRGNEISFPPPTGFEAFKKK